jgi:hypothetical protein
MLKTIIILLFFVFTPIALGQDFEGDVLEVESEATYVMRGNDSRPLAKALALFEAERKAVDVGAKYLATKGLIEAFGEKKREIYALATREIEKQIIDEEWPAVGGTIQCLLRIRARVKEADFIKAEIEDQRLEEEDRKESFRREMEPVISKETDPAKEVAKAYRLIRNREWRMAIIYLDRLEMKYPHWGEIDMAKALAYYALHEPWQMRRSLKEACSLGNAEACEDLKMLKKVHSIDLDK